MQIPISKAVLEILIHYLWGGENESAFLTLLFPPLCISCPTSAASDINIGNSQRPHLENIIRR